ncbi:MAG: CHAD domain-containing protein, partial [Chthoniobacterales bacterium]
MRCRLDKGEPIAPGLRRIAREQLEKALREISGTARRDEGAAVHATRKHIKRTRALLRLVRRELDSELFAGENERLRAVANGFSGSRDARVQLQVVEKLREDPKAFSETIAALEKEVAGCEEAFGKHRQKAVATLQQICDRIEGWPLDSVGGDALCDAVQRSYRHGRKCFHGLCDDPVSEDFHSWRKRVKDFWYQAQILQNLNRTILCEMADAAKSLGQQLGDLHDWACLRHRLE